MRRKQSRSAATSEPLPFPEHHLRHARSDGSLSACCRSPTLLSTGLPADPSSVKLWSPTVEGLRNQARFERALLLGAGQLWAVVVLGCFLSAGGIVSRLPPRVFEIVLIAAALIGTVAGLGALVGTFTMPELFIRKTRPYIVTDNCGIAIAAVEGARVIPWFEVHTLRWSPVTRCAYLVVEDGSSVRVNLSAHLPAESQALRNLIHDNIRSNIGTPVTSRLDRHCDGGSSMNNHGDSSESPQLQGGCTSRNAKDLNGTKEDSTDTCK